MEECPLKSVKKKKNAKEDYATNTNLGLAAARWDANGIVNEMYSTKHCSFVFNQHSDGGDLTRREQM